jgi:hypothetical protein
MINLDYLILILGNRSEKITDPLNNANCSYYYSNYYNKKILFKVLIILKVSLRLIRKKTILLIDKPGLLCFILLICTKLTKNKFVLRLRGDIWTEINNDKFFIIKKFKTLILNVVLNKCDQVIVVSNYLKKVCIKKNQNLAIKTSVVRIPFKVLDKKPKNKIKYLFQKYQSFKILTSITNFSFNGKTEGLKLFLPIFNNLIKKESNYVWFVVGNGKYLKQFKNFISMNYKNIVSNIIFLDSQESIKYIINRSNLIIYFSYEDTVSNVILEAAVEKKFIFVNKFEPLVESVNLSRENILSVNHPSKSAIKIKDILMNKNKKIFLESRLYNYIIEEHSLTRIANKYKSVFHKLSEY